MGISVRSAGVQAGAPATEDTQPGRSLVTHHCKWRKVTRGHCKKLFVRGDGMEGLVSLTWLERLEGRRAPCIRIGMASQQLLHRSHKNSQFDILAASVKGLSPVHQVGCTGHAGTESVSRMVRVCATQQSRCKCLGSACAASSAEQIQMISHKSCGGGNVRKLLNGKQKSEPDLCNCGF